MPGKVGQREVTEDAPPPIDEEDEQDAGGMFGSDRVESLLAAEERLRRRSLVLRAALIGSFVVMAMTVLDFMSRPELVQQSWDYFRNVQTKDRKYIPFITKDDPPATHLNADILGKYREQMRKYYYDPTKYSTYLEQLGIQYPTIRTPGNKQE